VEPRIAAAVGAGADGLADPGLFSVILVQPVDADAAQGETILLAQLEQLAENPVSDEEVAQAQQRLANNYDLYFTDVNAVSMGLSEFLAAGDWRLLFTSRDAIAAVTAADVNRVAASYLRRDNRTLGPSGPPPAPRRGPAPAPPPPPAPRPGTPA